VKKFDDLNFERQEARYNKLTTILQRIYQPSEEKREREKTLSSARQRLLLATSMQVESDEPVMLELLQQEQLSSVEVLDPGEMTRSRGTKTREHGPRRLRHLVNTLAAVIAMTLIVFLLGYTLLSLRQVHSQPGHPQTPTIQQSQLAQLYVVSGSLNSMMLSHLDPASGRALWHFMIKPDVQNGGQAITSPITPQVVKGILYFEDTDTNGMTVYALNSITGALVWKTPVGGAGTGVVVANGLVYTGQSSFGNESLLALDALTGKQAWQKHFAGSAPDVIDNMQVIGAVNNVLYAVSYRLAQEQSLLYALDAQTGQVLWQKQVAYPEEITIGKIVGNTLYLAGTVGPDDQGQSTSISAYNLPAGAQLWSTSISGSVAILAVEQQALYAMTSDKNQQGEVLPGSIYALQSSNGLVLWQQHSNRVPGDVLLVHGELYVASFTNSGSAIHITINAQGKYEMSGGLPWNLEALNESTGHLDRQQTLPADMSTPVLFGSDFYLTDLNGTMYVLDPSSGHISKTLPISGISISSPGVMLFVA